MEVSSHLLLRQVVGEVGNHDLGLGRDTIGRGAALATLTLGSSLILLCFRVSLVLMVVCDVRQWLNLSGALDFSRGGRGIGGGNSSFTLLLLFGGVLSQQLG